jgi:hypothetical protein
MYPAPSQINPFHIRTNYLFKMSSNIISHLYQLPKITALFVLQLILYEFLTFPNDTIKKGPFNAKLWI